LTYAWKIHYNFIKGKGGKMKKLLLGLVIVFGLAGCGQVYDREPVGVGFDNNELKLSPCACMQVYRA
jgi:hypothetical protein